jgi:hypothetical protein
MLERRLASLPTVVALQRASGRGSADDLMCWLDDHVGGRTKLANCGS